MINMVGNWLLGVTGAAILAAMAESLAPKGAGKQVTRLVCGLVILLAVIRPVMTLEVADLREITDLWQAEIQKNTVQLESQQEKQMKAVIEQEFEAYILDKTAQMGLTCTVRVICEENAEGVQLPDSISIGGAMTSEQQEQLRQALSQELGLAPEHISFTEEDST